MAGKVLAFEEVEKHKKKEDCWVIISGKVYDVTRFLEDHPGGDDVLLMSTGKDATEDFEDVGHSDDAKEKMNEFYIGKIDESTIPLKQQHSNVKDPSAPNYDGGEDWSKTWLYILTMFMLAVAGLMRFYTKEE